MGSDLVHASEEKTNIYIYTNFPLSDIDMNFTSLNCTMKCIELQVKLINCKSITQLQYMQIQYVHSSVYEQLLVTQECVRFFQKSIVSSATLDMHPFQNIWNKYLFYANYICEIKEYKKEGTLLKCNLLYIRILCSCDM